MLFSLSFAFLSSMAALGFALPHGAFHFPRAAKAELESSGGGPDRPVQGAVKVVPLRPRALAHAGFPRRGASARRGPSHGPRLPFPAFLSQGRPGPAPAPASRAPVSPLHHLQPKSETELRKKQGLHMWQKATNKGETVSLPASLKDSKQTCSGVPFTQRVTAAGCRPVTVHNQLCFGQCSSLFVPSEAPFGAGAGFLLHHRGPCSRCAPSKAHAVAVPLLCAGGRVQERRVMVVEECKCETSREETAARNGPSGHA